MPKDRVLHHFSLPEDLSRRLHELTKRPGSSMTQIVIDALTLWLDRGAANELDARYAIRFDRQTRAIERTERKVAFVAEALGTFVQHQLTLVAHQPPFDPETANLCQRRYQSFLELVGRRIARANGDTDAQVTRAGTRNSRGVKQPDAATTSGQEE